MKFTEEDIREYIRNNPGFFSSERYDDSFEVSVQTLVDMLNFFAKLQEKKKWEDLYEHLNLKSKKD